VNIFKQLIAGGLVLFAASNVMALPVTGTLEMTGGFYAIDSRGNAVDDASVATGVDFDFFGFDMFRATSADGDFAGLEGQVGTITDFQFDPFVTSIVDFWTIADFSFELTDVTRGFTNDPVNFLVLDGNGIISAAGFDDTVASWSFTGDTSGSGIFSWSATSAVSVPEPNILLLLSASLIGLGIRKKIL